MTESTDIPSDRLTLPSQVEFARFPLQNGDNEDRHLSYLTVRNDFNVNALSSMQVQ